ncbi:SDR family NAD(P)-dependent oxidoreductase [Halostella sp. JP-L12]|uniref:SDR family NAD(P)-dependent oxidoreductase n=1 Tax=Halostella TaxID=1843185 RepID=UPI000EF8100E|nr:MULTISPECIES: SDR family NAD(P)-dependent oxidoreductase [Halostella]NHN47172.1 SDR family NAD(P)-dependent oxidoreductase [Halostella sp. JP-L12]
MDGDTAVVTGATRGIGRAVAREFADAGADVVIGARDADEVDETVDEIEAAGGSASGVRTDVRDEFDVERLLETAARFGDAGVDFVVANAGVYHGEPGETPLSGESYAAFDDHLRTNARGVFATVREAIPHLAEDARVLVPTGSVAREAKPGTGSYAVSKAGAEAVARGFAADLDVPVGCVDPGVVATRLSGDGGRDPAEVAPMFRWAATEADPETLDGSVLDLRAWRSATR